MLLKYDKNSKKVIWWNLNLKYEECVNQLSDSIIWLDADIPDVESREGYIGVLYLNDDNSSIRVEYELMPEEPMTEPTINEKIYEAVIKSQDELRQEGADMMMSELVKRGLMV